MATKKIRVRHKKRTYRQRRSQRRVVRGGWPSLNMVPSKLKELGTQGVAAARQGFENAKQLAEELAVRYIDKDKIQGYRQIVINRLREKLDEVNKKQTKNIIDTRIQKFLPGLIEIIDTKKSEAIQEQPIPNIGGRSKRNTRKIQKGGFGAS